MPTDRQPELGAAAPVGCTGDVIKALGAFRVDPRVDEPPCLGLGSGLEVQCERVRAWLRGEIDKALREVAKGEQVELPCSNCGELVERSESYAEKALAGRAAVPLCLDCKWPERAAREDAEAVKFVELLGDSAEELAEAVAALS